MRIVVVLALGVVSGCVPSRTIQQWSAPQTLAEVNAELHRRIERVHLVDGTVIRQARSIEVRPDSVFWYKGNTTRRVGIETSAVDFIRMVPHYEDDAVTKQRKASMRLLVAAALAGAMISALPCGDILCTAALDRVAEVGLYAGAARVLIGPLVLKSRLPKAQTIYQRPVERYLHADER
ncbi:MAG: hypothetical protein RhofKO_27220 [Rhodothermales bacterium]